MKVAGILVLTVSAASAYADAYKCEVAGKTVYQQNPCQVDSQQGKLNFYPDPDRADVLDAQRRAAEMDTAPDQSGSESHGREPARDRAKQAWRAAKESNPAPRPLRLRRAPSQDNTAP